MTNKALRTENTRFKSGNQAGLDLPPLLMPPEIRKHKLQMNPGKCLHCWNLATCYTSLVPKWRMSTTKSLASQTCFRSWCAQQREGLHLQYVKNRGLLQEHQASCPPSRPEKQSWEPGQCVCRKGARASREVTSYVRSILSFLHSPCLVVRLMQWQWLSKWRRQ